MSFHGIVNAAWGTSCVLMLVFGAGQWHSTTVPLQMLNTVTWYFAADVYWTQHALICVHATV